ncbi:MAG: hypothetical protein M3220_18215 [Chloroflexota bacterium]|nr:hypothetical protein [Chloroflexota bacterium]
MKEERLQILRMVQEGTISAEEGAQLLAALGSDGGSQGRSETETSPVSRRWLRIRVTDKANERTRVNLSLPLGLLDWGLNMVEATGGINLVALREAIRSGAQGKILEVDESESGERVEIIVE